MYWHRLLERIIRNNTTSIQGPSDGPALLETRELFTVFGFTVCLHGLMNPDNRDEFHTHPCKSWRLLLSGWYSEEFLTIPWSVYSLTENPCHLITVKRRPGFMSFIGIYYTHRISGLSENPIYKKSGKFYTSKYNAINLVVHRPKTIKVKCIKVERYNSFNTKNTNDDHFILFEND